MQRAHRQRYIPGQGPLPAEGEHPCPGLDEQRGAVRSARDGSAGSPDPRRARAGPPFRRSAGPDGRLLAGLELPLRRPDLSLRQPAAREAAPARARQAAPARALGHDAGPELRLRPPQPRHPRARPRHDLRDRARARRSGAGGAGLPRGHLHRGVSADQPGRGGDEAPVHAVQLPRRHPEPRRSRDAGLDPRGRRAGLRAVARLRRGLRQPRPHRRRGRRRRRSGDRSARHQLALEQVPEPGAGRRVLPILHLNGYKIASPSFLARIPQDELQKLFEGYGYRPYFVEGHEPAAMHQTDGRRPRRGVRRDRADPGRGARARASRAAGVADDRAAHAQGLDLPGRDRRAEVRRLLAQPPGPDGRHGQARAREGPRALDEELPAAGAVRRGRPARGGAGRARPEGRAAHERQSARQRRAAAEGAPAARLPRLRGRGHEPRSRRRRGHARPGPLPARRHEAEPRGTELPRLQPRREQLEPLAGHSLRHQPLPGRRDPPRGRPHRAGRPGHGGLERAPVPGLARRVPAHRPPRLLQLLRGLHPHHRLDVQPARQVAEGVEPHPLAAASRLAQLPAELARLAAGPQRLLAPGSRVHRPRGEQEGRDHPRLPPARRQLPALGDRSLPAQPQLRERDRGRQAAGAAVAVDGRGGEALHGRHRDLGMGLERPRRRARRGDGLLRRRADARDAGRGRPAPKARTRAQGSGS